MKKALKKIAVMVTIVALTMGNSVLSAAESGFSTQFEVSDLLDVLRTGVIDDNVTKAIEETAAMVAKQYL